ncbi:MAG: sugar transferase [Candidatus Omnitrophota bacterium]|jgi:exopolysaccharide biosynthesis polyprenyl glycosylphosphotransferase
MLKEYSKILTKLLMIADMAIVAACFFAGYYLTERAGGLYSFNFYARFIVPFVAIWGILLYALGTYESFRTKKLTDSFFTILEIAFIGIGVSGILFYFFKIEGVSRAFIFVIFALSSVALSIEKIILMLVFRIVRREGYNTRNFLIVGTGKRAEHFISLLDTHDEWGFTIAGIVDDGTLKKGESVCGHKVIGSIADMQDIIHNNVIDEVVFVVPRSWLYKIEDAMRFCETEGLKISVAVDYFELKFSRAKQTDLHGFPLLSFESAPDKLGHLLFKRFFDIVVSGIALILLSPFFLIIALFVRLGSEGPVFFTQERIGLNGRRFKLYKFRTMVKNAEEKLDELKERNEMSGPVFKLGNDPRITKAGRILRKTSIDELPQLWNVFKGDMSLVGPRPPLLSEVIQYDNWHRRRLSMRPGITCLWQIKGRNRITDFDEWAKLDLEYIDNWSIILDFKILMRTIPVVLFGIGAK